MSEPQPEEGNQIVELAIAVGDEETLDELLGATLLATQVDGSVDPKRIVEIGGSEITAQLVRTVFSRLEGMEVVDPIGADEIAAYRTDKKRLIQTLGEVRDVILAREQFRRRTSSVDVEFVCTLPTNDPAFASTDPVDFGFGQITSRLLALCGRTTDSLVLFGPFLDSGGIEWLLPGLKGAIRSGAEVKLVSRELDPPGGKFAALEPLVEADEQFGGRLEIYDYFAASEDGERPLYTLHSKLVVVDGEAAYIGSANFTTYGFDEYFEVGVIVEGELVSDLDNLCSYLIENSAERVY